MSAPVVAEDVAALEALYRAELAAMVRLAHLITSSNAVAEELVHDAFIELYRRWDGVRDPKAYLKRTVVNRCRSHLRRLDVERRNPPPLPGDSLPPDVDETWRLIAGLPANRRVALVLRFYEDLSIAEIADKMGLREGTVKSLIHRGLKTLKERLS